MAQTWLVVGLGNPGARYAPTRHNVGQMVVAELAARRGESFRSHKAGARIAETWLKPGGDKVILALPNAFMNVSGAPVAALASFFHVAPDHVIVVHDELDLPYDTLRLKASGGHGGHNGLRDVTAALSTADFLRVRVGIGRPPGRQDPADWVLAPFGTAERDTLPHLVSDAADAVEAIIDEGLIAAQQRVHAPKPG